MTARAAFKQADATRAVNAVKAAGLSVARVEFNDNGIVVVVGEPSGKERGRRNPVDLIYGPET